MKLTVLVLLCLIGVAVAGQGGYGGGNGGGGKNHHKSPESSSSSESDEDDDPKKCGLFCDVDAKFFAFAKFQPPALNECKDSSNQVACVACCEFWGLSQNISKDKVGGAFNDGSCACCTTKCKSKKKN